MVTIIHLSQGSSQPAVTAVEGPIKGLGAADNWMMLTILAAITQGWSASSTYQQGPAN